MNTQKTPTQEEVINLFENFKNAWDNLNAGWQGIDHTGGMFIGNYPFNGDFNELSFKVNAWVNTSIASIKDTQTHILGVNGLEFTTKQKELFDLIKKELGEPNLVNYPQLGGACDSTWSIGGNKELDNGFMFGIDTDEEDIDNVFCFFRGEWGTEDIAFFRISVEQAMQCITERKYFVTDASGRDGSSQITFLQCLSMYENDHENFDDTEDSFYDWLIDAEIGNEYEYDNATTFKRIS